MATNRQYVGGEMIQNLIFVLAYIGEYMNVKNILFRIFTIAITVLFIFQGYLLSKSRGTIEQYRDREQEYTRTIEEYRNQISECSRVVSEVSTELGKGTESLQRQFNSIQELRAVLREIEQNYENLENIIGDFGVSIDNNSNSSNNNEVKE